MLGELSSAGLAWLAIDMAGPGGSGSLVLSPGDARVIDIADPDAAPATVNPLEPGARVPDPGARRSPGRAVRSGVRAGRTGRHSHPGGAAANLRGLWLGHSHRHGGSRRGHGTRRPRFPAAQNRHPGRCRRARLQPEHAGGRPRLPEHQAGRAVGWAGRAFPRGRSPGRRSAPATRKRARHQQRCGRPRYRVVPGRRAPGPAGGATASARRRRPRPGQEFSGRPAAHRRHRLCGAPQRTPRRVVRTPPGGRMVRSVARRHRFLRRGRHRGSPGRDGRIHRAPAGGTRARRDRVAVRPPSRGSCGA